jgi:hypothetical protein
MSSAMHNATRTEWPASVRLVDKTGWQQWFGEWFHEMGMNARPVGAIRLQSMMLQSGIAPGENLLSRGIIGMRDE